MLKLLTLSLFLSIFCLQASDSDSDDDFATEQKDKATVPGAQFIDTEDHSDSSSSDDEGEPPATPLSGPGTETATPEEWEAIQNEHESSDDDGALTE